MNKPNFYLSRVIFSETGPVEFDRINGYQKKYFYAFDSDADANWMLPPDISVLDTLTYTEPYRNDKIIYNTRTWFNKRCPIILIFSLFMLGLMLLNILFYSLLYLTGK